MRVARSRSIPPPLELECLKVLWTSGESSVRSVMETMQPYRPLAYTTVMTLMERLTRKGAVSRRKVGRGFVYAPEVDRETLRRKAIRELADSLFEGSERLMLGYLNGSGDGVRITAPDDERLDAALL